MEAVEPMSFAEVIAAHGHREPHASQLGWEALPGQSWGVPRLLVVLAAELEPSCEGASKPWEDNTVRGSHGPLVYLIVPCS